MHLPKISLLLAFLLTATLLVGASVLFWNPDQEMEPNLLEDFQVQEIAGTILYLDEVLTMSARMAAETGDPKWEERYRRHEPDLDAAIQEAMRLARTAFMSEGAVKTLGANEKLVQMENEAFDLVRQDNLDAATTLLFSDTYEEQKKVYSESLERITTALKNHVDENLKRHQTEERITLVIFLVALLCTTLFWVSLLLHARRNRS